MERDEFHTLSQLSPILTVLLEADDGLRQVDICNRCDYSRSSAYRKLNQLQAMDAVETRDDRYYITPFGRTASEKLSVCRQTLRIATLCEFLVEDLEDSNIELESFADGEILLAREENGLQPLLHLAERTREASTARFVTHSIPPRTVDASNEVIATNGGTVELVIHPATLGSIEDTKYADQFEMGLRAGVLKIWIADRKPPYQLALFDETMCLVPEDEARRPLASIETDNQDALEWAEQTYQQFKREGTRLTSMDEVLSPD